MLDNASFYTESLRPETLWVNYHPGDENWPQKDKYLLTPTQQKLWMIFFPSEIPKDFHPNVED